VINQNVLYRPNASHMVENWRNETRFNHAISERKKERRAVYSPIHRLLLPFGAAGPLFPPLLLLPPRAKAGAPLPPPTFRIALRTLRTSSPPPPPPPVLSLRDFFLAVAPSLSSFEAIAREALLSSSAERSLGSYYKKNEIEHFLSKCEKKLKLKFRTFRLTPRIFCSPSSLRSNLQGGGVN
jgi:hypothetical protein